VGRKIAERLIVEMRDRLELAAGEPAEGGGPGAAGGAVAPGAEAEAYGALVSLGYKPVEATRLLKGVGAASASLSTEDLIRRALQVAVHS
jgi:holliday junction DNA helicase RuvA